MKNARKLLPAIAMLLISAVMMSTASFAWFSMNTTVTATGMQIEAKSDQTFLIISATNSTAETIQAEFDTNKTFSREADLTDKVTEVYPSTVNGDPTKDSDLKFKYAVGTSYNNGAALDGEYTDITADNLTKYVVKYTFYITVAKGAVPAKNIVVTGITIDGDAAVAAVVTTDYAAVVFADTDADGDNSKVISSGEITDTTVLAVNVYVYFDGEHERVTTANAANLANTTVSVTFGVQNANP